MVAVASEMYWAVETIVYTVPFSVTVSSSGWLSVSSESLLIGSLRSCSSACSASASACERARSIEVARLVLFEARERADDDQREQQRADEHLDQRVAVSEASDATTDRRSARARSRAEKVRIITRRGWTTTFSALHRRAFSIGRRAHRCLSARWPERLQCGAARGTGVSVTRWSPKPQRQVRFLGPPLAPDSEISASVAAALGQSDLPVPHDGGLLGRLARAIALFPRFLVALGVPNTNGE